MDVSHIGGTCATCGKTLVHSRHGGPPKRFCSPGCRSAWHRAKPGYRRRRPPVQGTITRAELVATLEWLYGLLRADVAENGAVVGTRVNPSVATLLRVISDLARMVPEEAMEDGGTDIASMVR